jgi:serine/threonine protein kinase/Flp pilus assembly protein TadD
MASLIGKEIGKYRITERIGRGGMADVYLGIHTHLDRKVAVKVLHSHLLEGGDFVARFKREAKAVANLRHPNIVQVYDFDVTDEMIFMVMEYIDGTSLHSKLVEVGNRGERLPIKLIGSIINDIASALDYAHSKGMLHRDIKPSNILLDKNNKAYLTDFGIAKLLDDQKFTATGQLVGTPAYMSPEQGMGEELTEESDIYSLGIVAFEMLTGQVPYDAKTPIGIVHKQINDPVPELSKLVEGVPGTAQEVLNRALAKSPEGRYNRAEDLVQALRVALQALDSTEPIVKKAAAKVEEILDAPTVTMETGDLEKATVVMESEKPTKDPGKEPEKEPESKGKAPKKKIPTWAFIAGGVALLAVGAVILTQVLGIGLPGPAASGEPSGPVAVVNDREGSGEELFHQGLDFYAAGEVGAAIEAFENAIKAGYQDIEVYIQLGRAKRDFGDYYGAIEQLTTAVEMDPDNYGAWYSLAEAYFNTGEERYAGDAHDAMDHALALNPGDPNAHWLMGSIRYYMFGNPDEAINDLNEAIELDPGNWLFYNMRGIIYLETGQWELCVADYNRFVELDPGNPWAYKERGDCLTGLGDIDAARPDYQQALELTAQNPELEDLHSEIQAWLDSH